MHRELVRVCLAAEDATEEHLSGITRGGSWGGILWRRLSRKCQVGDPEREAENYGVRVSGTTDFFGTMHDLCIL